MMRSLPLRFLVIAALLAWPGCKGNKDKAKNQDPSQNAGKAGAAQAGAAQDGAQVVDPRSQYDLAAAITGAERNPPDQAAEALERVRRDWQGKRFRWTVYVVPALCPSADRCHVVPFDRAGKDRAILHGWMPGLELTPATLAALQKRCGAQPRCKIEFEGTLSRLVLSTEELTSLRFDDVRVIDPAADPAAKQAPDP